jgi:hypothetical protein
LRNVRLEPIPHDAAVCMNVSLSFVMCSMMFHLERALEHRRSKKFAGNGDLRVQQRRKEV